jgi:hypothetical protein
MMRIRNPNKRDTPDAGDHSRRAHRHQRFAAMGAPHETTTASTPTHHLE